VYHKTKKEPIEFRRLQSFRSAYVHGGFRRASVKLYITQSTVSKHIQYLENELGVVLFERRNARVIPTDACHNYFKIVEAIL
jgi:LysR family glycine cleavage system transcriptional activator